MDDPQDSLDALTRASAKRKSPSLQQVRKAQAARRRRNGILVLIVLLLIVAVGFYAFTITRAKPAPVAATHDNKNETPQPGQPERKARLDEAWAQLKDREPTKRYKPLIESARTHARAADDLWSQGKYSSAAASLDLLEGVMAEVRRLDDAKAAAESARADAEASAKEAESHEAAKLAPSHWAGAVSASDEARGLFEGDEFDAAAEKWREAREAFGRAALAADQGALAAKARADFEKTLTRRFDRAKVEAHGGEAWKAVAALVAAGDEDLRVNRFDEAKVKFEQAAGRVGEVERAVQVNLGPHFYALQCGYKAADMLLRRAAGDALGDARWDAMRQALLGVQLPEETVSALLSTRDGDYPAQGSALLEDARAAIAARWGDAVASSFVVGVHARLVERFLAADTDAFARHDGPEAKRSVVLIQRQAQAAGYPPELPDLLKQLTAKMAVKPEYEALRQSRSLWSDTLRKLDDFDEASKLLPPAPPSAAP